jgi:hypothetical protein
VNLVGLIIIIIVIIIIIIIIIIIVIIVILNCTYVKQSILSVNTASCFSHSQTITTEAIIGAVMVLINFTPLFVLY